MLRCLRIEAAGRARAPLLLLFCLVSAGPVRATPLPEYGSWLTLTYDAHSHPANAEAVAEMLDSAYDPAARCAHSYHWCDEVFDNARTNGLDALVQSHHTDQIQSVPGAPLLAWQTAGVDWQHPYGRGETYPTHPDGFPLLVSGGHTTDEAQALWECAESRNVPGQFIALYGGEYTVAAAGSASPGEDGVPCASSTGQGRCGGHKLLLYGDPPAGLCSDESFALPEDRCETEGDVYDVAGATSAVLIAAHPASTTGGADFTPHHPAVSRGGMSPGIAGVEFVDTFEDQACSGVGDASQCGFQQTLALGYRVFPAHGSDNHIQFGASGDGCQSDRGFPGESIRSRGICWAESFTRAGLLGAMESLRCYWASRDRPIVQWSLGGVVMGEVTVPADISPTEIHLEDPVGNLGRWEIHCGEVTGDGTEASPASLAGWRVCTDPYLCEASIQQMWTQGRDWCYLRVLKPSGALHAVTAPIWLGAPSPPQPEAVPSLAGEGLVAVAAGLFWLGVARASVLRRVASGGPARR